MAQNFGLIIVDEAHHACATMWTDVRPGSMHALHHEASCHDGCQQQVREIASDESAGATRNMPARRLLVHCFLPHLLRPRGSVLS